MAAANDNDLLEIRCLIGEEWEENQRGPEYFVRAIALMFEEGASEAVPQVAAEYRELATKLSAAAKDVRRLWHGYC